jgi:hypothetical protein
MTAYCPTPVVLTLSMAGATTLDLMDAAQGFRVEELDIGYPSVREDSNLNPGRNGTLDLTRLFGERAVTITGSLVPSAAGSRQAMWHRLAPFLDPGARPTLTYQVDGDVSPRTLTIRAYQVTGPYNNRSVSAVQLGFKSANPFAFGTPLRSATVTPVGGTGAGRAYDLTFPRVYPTPTAQAATLANYGDFTAYPLLRFYGPVTGPYASFNIQGVTPAPPTAWVRFNSTYVIPAGSYVEVDTAARTAFLNGDHTQSVFNQLAINPAEPWPYLPPGAPTVTVQMLLFTNGGTSNATQLVAIWADPFL